MKSNTKVYDTLNSPKKKLILLVDPDKYNHGVTVNLLSRKEAVADLIFVGGSLLSVQKTSAVIQQIKSSTDIPLVLFPGNSMQVCDEADAILFLSLLSGRNPDFLIGQHIHAAPLLYQSGIEVIPTSYLLIDGGNLTSVQYISQTLPIPANKPDIAVATALAGKYLGHQLTYLEAGSGAKHPVSENVVRQVAERTGLPLITGGGIRTAATAVEILKAGATAVVIGTVFENDPEQIFKMAEAIHNL